jgi:hypothetical protein
VRRQRDQSERNLSGGVGMSERRVFLSWAKAGKDSEGRSKATRSEGDDLEESAARALMRHGGRGIVREW